MKLSEIEKKARNLGMKNVWSFSKTDLIRSVQKREGNFDCFDRASNYCDQSSCCWREDCLK